MSGRKVRGVVRLDLDDSGGSGRAFDSAAVSKVLDRASRLASPVISRTFRELANALRAQPAGEFSHKIDLTAVEADEIRTALIAAAQAQTDARKAAGDLIVLRRSWDLASDFANRPLAGARAAPRPVR